MVIPPKKINATKNVMKKSPGLIKVYFLLKFVPI